MLKNSLSNNLIILPGNYKKCGKRLIVYFCLRVCLFQRFKCDHHFPLNLKEKTNNVNTSYKSFEVLWNAGRC